ncbi:MAG TPA: preprotein translocase subunit SecG [Gemmatimonadaceae bacterium]|nr:preprotein translocase subunit SecG [Gemmatimonadaceae bacterium]
MYTFILVLLVIDSLICILSVLLQAGKGGGLAAAFGGVSSAESFVGTRQAANLLTKTSWWTGGIFMALAFLLQIMGTRSNTPKSVLDQPFSQQAAPTAPAPTTANPAVPLQPAAPAQKAPAQAPTTPPKK